jgi:alpha-tubulin suppressor-like RCC1 family protein
MRPMAVGYYGGGTVPAASAKYLGWGAYAYQAHYIDANNYAWGTGLNGNGNIGDNTVTSRSSHVSVAGGHQFSAIANGYNHTAGLKTDGSIWTWGYQADYGQLGIGNKSNKSSPVSTLFSGTFTDVVVGGYDGIDTVALRNDGTIWTCGLNMYGQLGDGSLTNRSSPVSVVGGRSYNKLCKGGGEGFHAALMANGTAWMWGWNNVGQLGINAAGNKSSPVSVVGGHSFIQISCGGIFTIALKADGTAWTWGQNYLGSLGINAAGNKSSPVTVAGPHSFIYVSAGYGQGLGLKADGSLWTWGRNEYGNLGYNTVTHRSSPVSVVGGHSFIRAAMLNSFCYGLRGDGVLMVWGLNTDGTCGTNDLTNRSSPVSIARS